MKRIFILFSILISFPLYSQVMKKPEYTLQSGATLAGGRMAPFWMVSNKYGTRSVEKASGFLAAGLASRRDTGRFFDYDYGIKAFERFDGKNALFLQEAFIELYFGNTIKITGGKKEKSGFFSDHVLSTGGTVLSRNARPLPEIIIETGDYIDIPLTRGYLEVKALLSHGWFGKESYVKNQLLHHKNLYFRIGGDLPVNISGGLEHYAIWGGTSPDPRYGKLPDGWDAYKRIFFADEGDAGDPGTPIEESVNKLGNHLGSWNYRIDIMLKKYDVGLYYETIFEDNSGYRKLIMPDGLWGIVIETGDKTGIVAGIVFEHFESTYQSGGFKPEILGGFNFDNYFNHGIYRSGWTYNRYTIGNPLITSPILSQTGAIDIENNRVSANHFGVQGNITQSLQYRCLVTFSKNLGTFLPQYEPARRSASVLFGLKGYPRFLRGIEAAAEIGFDVGEAYGNNVGLGITLTKRGPL